MYTPLQLLEIAKTERITSNYPDGYTARDIPSDTEIIIGILENFDSYAFQVAQKRVKAEENLIYARKARKNRRESIEAAILFPAHRRFAAELHRTSLIEKQVGMLLYLLVNRKIVIEKQPGISQEHRAKVTNLLRVVDELHLSRVSINELLRCSHEESLSSNLLELFNNESKVDRFGKNEFFRTIFHRILGTLVPDTPELAYEYSITDKLPQLLQHAEDPERLFYKDLYAQRLVYDYHRIQPSLTDVELGYEYCGHICRERERQELTDSKEYVKLA
jgi:hypothetical protein